MAARLEPAGSGRWRAIAMSARWRSCLTLIAILACAASYGAPSDLSSFSFVERPGAPLPAQLPLRESDGATVTLSGLAQGKPLILVLGYFHCENLCGLVRASLYRALNAAGLRAGRDYVLAVLSIDPKDTSAQARAAKAQDIDAFGVADPRFVHYLTGDGPKIDAVSAAVGFRDRYDAPTQQFIHPAGVVFATSAAVVSNYLLGVGYTPAAVRAAVQRAGAGTIAAAGAPLLLICFHFDPTTGRYSLEILKVLRLAAILTVFTLGAMFYLLNRRPRGAA
jgi:protein SCO1